MAFQRLTNDELVSVAGGKATSQADLQLTQMLTDISNSIQEANDAKAKAASDPMQMMTMMMMLGGLGGLGGSGGGAAAAPPPPAQPVVEQPSPNVVRVRVG
jgi:hypothetical protein